MTDIKPLLSIVEAATGPSDEIDIDLMVRFLPAHRRGIGLFGSGFEEPVPYVERFFEGVWYGAEIIPYTSSIDAAVALIEREMPGHGWLLGYGREWSGRIFGGMNTFSGVIATEQAPTAPLCLLKLLLRAKLAESEAS